jgi:hypothetical protein
VRFLGPVYLEYTKIKQHLHNVHIPYILIFFIDVQNKFENEVNNSKLSLRTPRVKTSQTILQVLGSDYLAKSPTGTVKLNVTGKIILISQI